MPTRVLLLADTHLPIRAKALPPRVVEEIEAADLVIHAGDWVDAASLDDLESRSARLLACWGNNDGPDLRSRLPEIARATIERVRVAVVHETGPRTGRERRMDEAFPDTDLVVFGHSHIPWDTTTPDGVRLLNPGSPTDRRRQPFRTCMTVTLDDGDVREVALIRIPDPRGAAPVSAPRG